MTTDLDQDSPNLDLCPLIERSEFYVDQVVRDFPSNTITRVVSVSYSDERSGFGAPHFLYKVDRNVPKNPTGDGAFTSHWRTESEIGLPDQPIPDDWDY